VAPSVDIDRKTAMQEIMDAVRDTFPDGGLTPRDDAIVVNLGHGNKPAVVRFTERALDRYMAADEAFRRRACEAVARTCAIRMAMDYVPTADPRNPLVISAALELENPG